MTKPKILMQLDSDEHASVFDAVVAVDSGVEHLLQYANVEASVVRDLVHGLMFTRGIGDLRYSAVFIGGSDVAASEKLLKSATDSFFGPMRVSVMLDASGANTTAAAAVVSAAKHIQLARCEAVVLGATGPVGQRAALMLASEGAHVRVASRALSRAESVCNTIKKQLPDAKLSPMQTADAEQTAVATDGASIVIAAGAAGTQLLSSDTFQQARSLKVAIDLNAVPPAGIEPIKATDKAAQRHGILCYGALGVGGLKMRIHTAALTKLFEQNDLVFDAREIYALGKELGV